MHGSSLNVIPSNFKSPNLLYDDCVMTASSFCVGPPTTISDLLMMHNFILFFSYNNKSLLSLNTKLYTIIIIGR